MICRSASVLALGLAVLTPGGAARAAPQESVEQAHELAPVPREELPAGAAAVALGTTVSTVELEQLLIDRYSLARDGREVLRHLVECAVLERLGGERGVIVSDRDVNRRWAELDRQASPKGSSGGLLDYLRAEGVAVQRFRETLRLGILHERLTRLALGLPRDAAVSSEQQSIWLEQEIAQRGLEELPPPFVGGIAARWGRDLTVSEASYREALREMLPNAEVEEACYLILLDKRLSARLARLEDPPTAGELERAVEAEIERRRLEAAGDPRYKDVPYEALLRAQGLRVETWHLDPAVRVAAMSHLYVDRTFGEEGLRRHYEENRDHFEGQYGMAVKTRALFLRAARLTNELNPRSFEEAERELARLAERIDTEEEFAAAALEYSEDAFTRKSGGDLGYVTRDDERVGPELRDLIFTAAGVGKGRTGRARGPVRVPTGAALFWISEVRPSPPWEDMATHVHRELRKQLVDDTLPRQRVRTFLDRDQEG